MWMKLGERVLSCSGPVEAQYVARVSWGEIEPETPPPAASARMLIRMPWEGEVELIGPEVVDVTETVNGQHPLGYADFNMGWSVRAKTGFGSEETATHWHTTRYRVHYGQYYDWSVRAQGTWEISVPVEIFAEFTFGDWNGYEAPPATYLRIVERLQIGGVARARLDVGTVVEATTVITADNAPFPMTQDLWYAVELHGQCQSTHTSGYSHAKVYFMGRGAALSAPYVRSSNGATVDASSCTCITASSTSSRQAEATITLWPPREYQWEIDVRRLDQPYGVIHLQLNRHGGPGGQVSVSTDNNGRHVTEYAQQQYACTAELLGEPQEGLSLNEYGFLEARMVPGEDVRDERVLFRCFAPYQGFTIHQNGTMLVDSCQDLSPAGVYGGSWAGTHCTVTVSGGIRIQTHSGSGTARRTFAPRWGGFSGYRYLAIQAQSETGAVPFSVEVRDSQGAVKRWTKTTGGSDLVATTTAQTFVLDLCNPDGISTVDDTDVRWPLPSQDGSLYGVTNAQALDVNLPANSVLKIQEIRLERNPTGHSDLRILPAFGAWHLEQTSQTGNVTTETYVRMFLDGVTDGRRSLQLSDCVRQVVTGSAGSGGSDAFWMLTLQQLYHGVNSPGNPDLEANPLNAGWVANHLASVQDPPSGAPIEQWMNALRPATWLWGSGALWAQLGSDPEKRWHWGDDPRDCRVVQSMLVQPVADRITQWPPDTGDLFRHLPPPLEGRAEGPLICRSAAIVRGRAYGVVLGAINGTEVTVEEIGGNNAGSGTPGLQGVYRTGLPYGRGNRLHRVQCQGFQSEKVWQNRRQYWIGYRLPQQDEPAHAAMVVDSTRQWLHVSGGAKIRTLHLATMALGFQSVDWPVDFWMRLRIDPRRGHLYALGKQGSTWKGFRSEDGGATGEEIIAVTARTATMVADSERGALVIFWENQGPVQRQASINGGQTWSAPQAILEGSQTVTGEILDSTHDRRRPVLLLALKTSTGVRILLSEDLGETWTNTGV